jgi:hypothetical protein
MNAMLKAKARVRTLGKVVHVNVFWEGAPIDRANTFGFRFPSHERNLVSRLVRAIDAQAVFINPTLRRDMNGRAYVSARGLVLARDASADLSRLGF